MVDDRSGMTRHVLHLYESAGPQASAATLAMLADAAGRIADVHQSFLLLGSRELQHDADAVGLHDAMFVAPPGRRALTGWAAMRHHLRAVEDAAGPVDLVHCWSIDGLTWAALARRGTPRLLTLAVEPTKRQCHWLRFLVGETAGRTAVLCASNTIRRRLVSHGVHEQAVHVLRPAIDMGRIVSGARKACRQRWDVDDQAKVVALLGDPPDRCDVTAGALAVSSCIDGDETGALTLRLLCSPRAPGRQRAATLNRDRGRPGTLIVDPISEQPWAALPGCDFAIAAGEHIGLSLLWAMAANVPIIGEAHYGISEIVEDRHSALLVKPERPIVIADRLTRLLRDRHETWQLRDTARHECYSFFSRQRYCKSLRNVYAAHAAGEPVDIPPMEPTGGLRFAGRA